jgi:CubicO group peptidase (beta-lactamase class C family)
VKPLRLTLLVLLLALLGMAASVGRNGLQIGVGYSAKQLCSGVFVSGLPQSFVWERDVWPRSALFGPLRHWLDVRTDTASGLAEASLLGVSAQAVHVPPRGCVLHGTGQGAPPLEPLAAPATDRVPAPLQDPVDAAFAEPPGGGRNTLALLVASHGRLIAERYTTPVTPATPLQGWSMNKSLLATWIGMQTAAGALDPARTLAGLLPDEPLVAALDERLTLLHLLQMESGLDFAEVYAPWGDATRMLYRSPAMWTVPASREQAFDPGSHFAYSSGDSVLASLFWQRSLPADYSVWIEENFRKPLGLQTIVAESDASGVQVGSSYTYMTGRDWLTVGQLWLDAWHGRSELLSREWLRESVRRRDSDPHGQYGRGFWLNTAGVAFPALPESAFYASGNAGQYVVVVPEWELVLVRLGLTDAESSTGTADFLRELAERLVSLAALDGPVLATTSARDGPGQ